MTDDRDLDDLLRDALDARADRLPATRGRLLGVLDRVERRRNRRRRGVAVGSVAVVGLGVVGLVTTGGAEPERAASDGDGTLAPVEATTPSAPATIDLGDELWWACSGELERKDGVVYYASCERVPSGARLLTTDEVRDLAGSSATTSIVPIATTVPAAATDGTDVTISDEEQQYTIVAGDSIFGVAELYGVEPELMATYNQWLDGIDHVILPGDIVLIPPGALVVQEPDDLRQPDATPGTITSAP